MAVRFGFVLLEKKTALPRPLRFIDLFFLQLLPKFTMQAHKRYIPYHKDDERCDKSA